MAPYRILILSDGRPGHFNLSEGIAAAIERLRPATTERFDVRRGRWPGALVAGLTRARLPARQMLRRIYGIDEASVPACDAIVSAGAETLAASVWLARVRGVPNIFYGSLRLFDARDFSLVLTSYQRNANKPRHALALKPSRFDPDATKSSSSVSAAKDTGGPLTLGLLVGGDAGGITFSTNDWDQLIWMVSDPRWQGRIQWMIANSRRTPDEVGDRLASQASAPDTAIAQFLDVRTAGPGTLAALLARCDAVLCTADSSSMISECVWSRKPTLSLRPALCTFTTDEAGYRTWLEQSRWCADLSVGGAAPDVIFASLSPVQPLTENPLEALAGLLQQRLPSLVEKLP